MKSQLKKRYFDYIKLNKLKSSKRRDLIFEHIVRGSGHFTIDNLYQNMLQIDPSIGIATVYRTIRLLVEIGIVTEHSFGEKKGYFELKTEKSPDHSHLICIRCGKIIEFEFDAVEKIKKKLTKQYRFKIEYHKCEIFGLCSKCQ